MFISGITFKTCIITQPPEQFTERKMQMKKNLYLFPYLSSNMMYLNSVNTLVIKTKYSCLEIRGRNLDRKPSIRPISNTETIIVVYKLMLVIQ